MFWWFVHELFHTGHSTHFVQFFFCSLFPSAVFVTTKFVQIKKMSIFNRFKSKRRKNRKFAFVARCTKKNRFTFFRFLNSIRVFAHFQLISIVSFFHCTKFNSTIQFWGFCSAIVSNGQFWILIRRRENVQWKLLITLLTLPMVDWNLKIKCFCRFSKIRLIFVRNKNFEQFLRNAAEYRVIHLI